ncbi:MAG: DnaD domain protein [Lachnospiraceae bacterium]|nr:DnaD domain protein [Lachnospiraceae bacterium]
MNCLTLRAQNQADYTSVSNIFIDKFMPQTNGEFVKIYLYLLRCMNDSSKDLSISSIADHFDQTEKDVIRALRYFAGKGLLSIDYNEKDEISAITFLPFQSEFTVIKRESKDFEDVAVTPWDLQELEHVAQEPSGTGNIAPATPSAPSTPSVVSSSRLEAKTKVTGNERDEWDVLVYMTERLLGTTLNKQWMDDFIFFHEDLHFSYELIGHLIESCVDRGHKERSYIRKVAIDWAEHEITTIAMAKDYAAIYSKEVRDIMKAFGLNGRFPGTDEMEYINRWTREYHFSNDIILEACNRTIHTIHKPSFSYAEEILCRWKDLNIQKFDEIKSKDQNPNRNPVKLSNANKKTNNRFNNVSQRTYDFNAINKKIMED